MAWNLYHLLVFGHTPWLVLAWGIVSSLARFGMPAARQRLQAPTVMAVLHVILVVLVGSCLYSCVDAPRRFVVDEGKGRANLRVARPRRSTREETETIPPS